MSPRLLPSSARPAAFALGLAGLLSPALASQSTQQTVLPGGYEQTEGETLMFWSFSPFGSRRQLLIDTRHMSTLGGRSLTAIELRRDGGAIPLQGGSLRVEVRISHAPSRSRETSELFAQNRGPDEQLFFAGNVNLPSHSGVSPDPAPWDQSASIVLRGTRPFPLRGTTLCIETVTRAPQSQSKSANPLPFWPIDAARGVLGSVQSSGISCMPGSSSEPAYAEAAGAVTGSKIFFTLQMTKSAPAFAFLLWGLNNQSLGGLPLPLHLGPAGMPGCYLSLEPLGSILANTRPLPISGLEQASVQLPVPMDANFDGLSVHAQWMRFSPGQGGPRFTFSNGVEATVSSVSRDFGFCYVRADSVGADRGELERSRIPILRLHHE
jgi:hypothetical protein